MKTNTLFQVRFRPSVKPPRGFTKSAHYNVTDVDGNEYLIGNTWLPAKDFIKIEIEDAPVFNKPVLRKIASLKPDEVIECNTDAEVKAVLEQAIKEGLKDAEATLIQINESESIDSYPLCIGYKYKLNDYFFQNNGISYSRRSFYESECCTILPASKFVEVAAEGKGEQVEIDRPIESYKPFPKGYVIPKGIRVIKVAENDNWVRQGSVGVSLESSYQPYINWENDDFNLSVDNKDNWAQYSYNLAPLDPRDHPEHPEFGKKKQEEPITQAQKDECRKIDDEIFQNPFSNQGKLVDRNTQLQERVKELEEQLHQQKIADVLVSNDISAYKDEIRQLTKRYERIVSICNDAQYNANADLMYITLRSIANGEI